MKLMPTLSQYVREIAEDEFTIPACEVESLVERFGSQVRGMGFWNADGTLTLSRAMIRDALKGIAKRDLLEGAMALNSAEAFSKMLDSSAARTIIERLAQAKERRLTDLMKEAQETHDPERLQTLRREIVRLIFPE